MDIIFANRSNCLSSPGGDTVQMLKTIEYLEKNHNVNTKICLKPEQIINDINSNIVHIFNIQTIDETLDYIDASKLAGKKIALSTIYWDLSHHVYMHKMFQITNKVIGKKHSNIFKNMFFDLTYFRTFFKSHKNKDSYATKLYIDKRKRALLEADILLPNSLEELEVLSKEFKIDLSELYRKSVIIPNAVDINQNLTKNTNHDGEKDSLKVKGEYVLEVGRLEVNKNQYNVVKALYNRPEIPIVFIGRINDNKIDYEYFNKLKDLSEKRGNVFFIDQIPQEEVFEYYKHAKVHVLPSFRESPGLSSLEALYFGCEIVTSSKEFCPVDYYKFNDKAHICNPYSVNSIRNAILDAFDNPKNKIHDEEYFELFSYERVSNLTFEAYKKITSHMDGK